MALQYEVPTLDGMDEATTGLYVKVGDVYRLDVKGVEDVTGLKNALEATRRERDAEKAKLKEIADAKAEIEAAKEAAEAKRLEEAGEYKTLAEKAAERELAANEELKALKDKLSKADREKLAGDVITDITKGIDTARAQLMKEQALKFIQTNEAGESIIAGPDGITESAKLAEHLKTAFPFLAGGSQASGGGAFGGSSGVPTGKKLADLTDAELIDLRKNNPAEYKRVMEKG